MPSKLYDVNNPDWAPSLKLGYDIHTAGSRERHERMTARRARKRAAEPELRDGVPELRDRNDEILTVKLALLHKLT